MLSSTNRRILHVICLSLAIVTMSIGLAMKYTPQTSELEIVKNKIKVEIVAVSDSSSYYALEELGEPD